MEQNLLLCDTFVGGQGSQLPNFTQNNYEKKKKRHTNTTVALKVEATDGLQNVKAMVKQKKGTLIDQQWLICVGTQPENGHTLSNWRSI